jgi:putative oxidoreductase
MSETIARWAGLVGRILLSQIFILAAISKIADPAAAKHYMESAGMPAASLLLVGAIVCELTGGLSVLLGFQSRWGALLLIVFLVPTTLIFHHFWDLADAARNIQKTNFMKNLAILGGLTLVSVCGSVGVSVDAWLRGRTAPAAAGQG